MVKLGLNLVYVVFGRPPIPDVVIFLTKGFEIMSTSQDIFSFLGNESVQMTRMRAHWWMFRNPRDAVVLLGSRLSQSKTIESVLLQGT